MLYLMPIAGAVALYFIIQLVALYLSPAGPQLASTVRTISPLANFLLPGINPYLPLSVWLAVIVAVVIHEAAHGIVARSLGLPIKSAGVLLLLFLPIGAFVEVDEKKLKEVPEQGLSSAYSPLAAGINFIVGIACILLLILTVSTMVPAVKGAAIVGVVPDSPTLHSPAYVAGIQPGDFVVAINNSPVTDLGVLHNGSFSVGEKVNVTIWRGGQTKTIPHRPQQLHPDSGQHDERPEHDTDLPVPGREPGELRHAKGDHERIRLCIQDRAPLAYLAEIPTFTRFETSVPFSDAALALLHLSPRRGYPAVTVVALLDVLRELQPRDIQQPPDLPHGRRASLRELPQGRGKGRISDELARRVTTGVTLAIFLALFVVIAGPYIAGVLPPT